MSRLICVVLLLCAVVQLAHAEPVPEKLSSMFPARGSTGKKVISLASLSDDQRNFQMHGTKINSEGYLEVAVPPAYVAMLATINLEKHFKPSRGVDPNVEGLVLLGIKEESPLRTEYVFGGRNGVDVLLTVWKYKADGASVVVTEEFVNQKIAGIPATLSLAIAPGIDTQIWKVLAINDDTFYDVIISNPRERGSGKFSSKRALQLAEKLVLFGQLQ
jgi:hypothetical protein